MSGSAGSMTRVEIDRAAVLDQAERRVYQLAEIRKSRRGQSGEAVEQMLERSIAFIRDVAQPGAVFLCQNVLVSQEDVEIGAVCLRHTRLARLLASSNEAVLYLATTGYRNVDIFEQLDRDYVLYHFSHYVSQMLLYSTAGHLIDAVKERMNGSWQPYAICERAARFVESVQFPEGKYRLYWDAATISTLFEPLRVNPLGITVTPLGCFDPVYSLMGIMCRSSGK